MLRRNLLWEGPVMLSPDAILGNDKDVAKFLRRLAAKFEGKRGRRGEREWLGTIAVFERHLLSLKRHEKTNDQLFYRYREMIKEWVWPLPVTDQS